MLDSPEEAASLLRGPPSYDASNSAAAEAETQAAEQQPDLEFDIDEPEQLRSHSWFSRMSTFGKQRIYVPVRHVIDPIAHLWHAFSLWTDRILGRYINPLLAKRLLFVLFTGIIVGILYYSHADEMLKADIVHYDHAKLRDALRSYISVDTLRETTEFFGQMPHYAGSVADRSTAVYVHDMLHMLNNFAEYNPHDVFLSHGNYTHCTLLNNGEVVWESDLLEGQAIEHPNPSQQQPRTHMALSLPGEAEGALVYINFGSEQDLKTAGNLAGNIGLVKLGREDAGSIALRAQNAGLAGLLFFSSKHPTEPMWPEGRDYPMDGIQQAGLGFPSEFPGDILSPGWPSSMQMEVSLNKADIAQIPAAAISWNDAAPLISALAGQGRRMDTTNSDWGNNGVPANMEWWTGPSTNHTVRLVVHPEAEPRHQITNVFSEVRGRESAQVVIIGARLDAMCYGASQMVGLNVLLEVARVFANLRYDKQWKPLRKIKFAAWDGTSHNFAGSTEWVESVADSLSFDGVTYIDLDMGITGPEFVVQGHPAVEVVNNLKRVSYNGGSLWDAVDHQKSFKPIPGYGNHIAFDSHTGVPSVRVGFQGEAAPIDSCYDSVEWMHKFGDPDYQKHRALVEFVVDLVLELADAPLVPFDLTKFGQEINRYINNLREEAVEVFGQERVDSEPFQDVLGQAHRSADSIASAGVIYNNFRDIWNQSWALNAGESGIFGEPPVMLRERLYSNELVINLNKGMMDRNGIAHRNWYKHHLFGPEFNYAYGNELSGTFPAVRDGLKVVSEEYFIDTLRDAASHIRQAAKTLQD